MIYWACAYNVKTYPKKCEKEVLCTGEVQTLEYEFDYSKLLSSSLFKPSETPITTFAYALSIVIFLIPFAFINLSPETTLFVLNIFVG